MLLEEINIHLSVVSQILRLPPVTRLIQLDGKGGLKGNGLKWRRITDQVTAVAWHPAAQGAVWTCVCSKNMENFALGPYDMQSVHLNSSYSYWPLFQGS